MTNKLEAAKLPCDICGKSLKSHNMGHGYPMCGIYAVYRAPTDLARENIALKEAMGRQTALVDRLCAAVEREVEGIGGEGSLTVLKLLGPVNDEAIALLGGRDALKLSEETGS